MSHTKTIAADFSNLSELVLEASNMVTIEALIYEQVWNKYSLLFCATDRYFVRANETQAQWIQAVTNKYGHAANAERVELFALIPSRFHKTAMYERLQYSLHARIAA